MFEVHPPVVFHYSKSVSHKKFKCLVFASVQVKPILQAGHFFPHSKQNENYQDESYLTQ